MSLSFLVSFGWNRSNFKNLVLFSRVNESLCDEMVKRKVDLIVIEGMGRSVHTNLNAAFTCESLKVAVIKNRWLAQRLGGEMFSVICRYQNPEIL